LRHRLVIVLAAIGLTAAACASRVRPPYPLAFIAAVHSPRLLETARETAVPVVLTNAGQRAWDPDRIHLSYHWLWLVPRELAHRSRWDVPYNNGIRTDLPGAVTPGAAVTLQGRLRPPSWPGLYWLQWDMVEEGAQWFAQASPRQPRTLVLVLPPAAWLFAPLPLLVAIAGIWLSSDPRRGTGRAFAPAFAATADVWWCATALAVKPLVVVHEALLEPTAAAYWLTAAVACAVPLAALLALPRRVRAWTLVVVGIVGAQVVLADVVYYRFFGDVLSAPALLAAQQTGRVWGSIRSLFTPALAWLVVDWPFAVWLAARVSRGRDLPRRTRAAVAAAVAAGLAAIGAALSVGRTLSDVSLGQMFRDRAVVEQLGLFGYHAYDGWSYARSTWMRPPVTDAQLHDVAGWFTARAPLRAARPPLAGVASGLNLIVVQVESLQDFVVDYRIDGQDVMPHLWAWTRDSLRFTNVTDETSQGRTSDAEFTTMASLLPLDQGAVAFRFSGNHYAALPRVLRERGYRTLSAVAFEPGFWNRQVMHPAYGFERSLFELDFQLTEQIGWGLNDRDFLQQMLPRLDTLPQPFAAWLITLSLHHPFEDFPARHKTLQLGALDGTSFGNYLHTMRFFDSALEEFRSALARSGLLDRTVVVVFGDHDAGFARDAALSRLIGIADDEAAWTLNDRVPLFVRVPHAESTPELHGPRGVPAGQTDFAPTLLGLLGVDASGLPYVGRNLLGAPAGPVPRPYGEWLDDEHLFLTRGSAPECRSGDGRRVSLLECRAADEEARREREASRLVVTADLQEKLRALMR
jgi:phosphoglycerol transferase MdoB-like AlkP superfamily enzyme